MKTFIALSFILLCSFLFSGNSADTKSTQAAEITEQGPCCFVREGYQGVFQVTPAEKETCASILEYLNTSGTVGKDYCGASKLRGGWKTADCPEEESEENA